ncbi:hypothetical protein SGLAM104S_09572 [Streptomyces glaucescens]
MVVRGRDVRRQRAERIERSLLADLLLSPAVGTGTVVDRAAVGDTDTVPGTAAVMDPVVAGTDTRTAMRTGPPRPSHSICAN